MVKSKHCTPTRWTCYTLTVVITLAIIAVIVVVTLADDEVTNRQQIREGYEKRLHLIANI